MTRTALAAVVCTVLLSTAAQSAAAQEGTPAAAGTPEALARELAARPAVAQLAGTDTLTLKIPKDPEMFALPDGASPALLVRLPDRTTRYDVSVRSYMFKPVGLTLKVFVPTVAVLDDTFTLTRTMTEDDLYPRGETFSKGQSFEVVLAIEPSLRNERFLLLYTNGRKIGGYPFTAHVRTFKTPYQPKRTAEGTVEVRVLH